MKSEYNLSNAERGKFYRSDAVLMPPIHPDPGVQAFIDSCAQARGISIAEPVSALLKRIIDIIKAGK